MSNHFHVLVSAPQRPGPEELPSDEELIKRVQRARMAFGSGTLRQQLEQFRSEGDDAAAEALRERFLCRMWDVSWFMRLVKQRFAAHRDCFGPRRVDGARRLRYINLPQVYSLRVLQAAVLS